MKIKITMDVDPSFADPGHSKGVTEEAFVAIVDALDHLGTNIDVSRADE